MNNSVPTHDLTANRSQKIAAGLADLRWLVRYARHCGFHALAGDDLAQALRETFGAAAWRIICRSPKEAFIPILRNPELSIHSLITYCKRLAERSFVRAPKPILLAYFVRQRRLYFDRPCRIPEGDDYNLIRIASRHEQLRLRDIACVANWAHESCNCILLVHKWSTLVMRARRYNEQKVAELASVRHEPWHFFCRNTTWRGYQVEPITDPAGLWHEGQRHGNCLFKLRYDCTALKPSRFFRVGKRGRSIATLELAWRPPEPGFRGMDLVWGRWEMQDLRLSFNRLPDEALVQSMRAFGEMYNLLSKRLRRMPPGYVQDTRDRVVRANRMAVWSLFISEEQTPA
jgi:hypothetical protein